MNTQLPSLHHTRSLAIEAFDCIPGQSHYDQLPSDDLNVWEISDEHFIVGTFNDFLDETQGAPDDEQIF